MEERHGSGRIGLVQVYTGTGKGKTTAALGLSLRACGKGQRVHIIQFMKGKINYGELEAVKNLPDVNLEQFGRPDFVSKSNPEQIDIDLAGKGLDRAEEIVEAGEVDVLILDELNVALDFGLVEEGRVIKLLKDRPRHMEIVLTGRDAPASVIDAADLVSVISDVKHPHRKGIGAREGIEY